MSGYLDYITKDGDRWDFLAWQYYGDALRYEEIILANPDVPIDPVLPAGIRLLIPVLEPATQTDAAGLPPWK